MKKEEIIAIVCIILQLFVVSLFVISFTKPFYLSNFSEKSVIVTFLSLLALYSLLLINLFIGEEKWTQIISKFFLVVAIALPLYFSFYLLNPLYTIIIFLILGYVAYLILTFNKKIFSKTKKIILIVLGIIFYGIIVLLFFTSLALLNSPGGIQ